MAILGMATLIAGKIMNLIKRPASSSGGTKPPGVNDLSQMPKIRVISSPVTKEGIAMKVIAAASDILSAYPPGRAAHKSPIGRETSAIITMDIPASVSVTGSLEAISSLAVIPSYRMDMPKSPRTAPLSQLTKRSETGRSYPYSALRASIASGVASVPSLATAASPGRTWNMIKESRATDRIVTINETIFLI